MDECVDSLALLLSRITRRTDIGLTSEQLTLDCR
jgi:hypothetical protein